MEGRSEAAAKPKEVEGRRGAGLTAKRKTPWGFKSPERKEERGTAGRGEAKAPEAGARTVLAAERSATLGVPNKEEEARGARGEGKDAPKASEERACLCPLGARARGGARASPAELEGSAERRAETEASRDGRRAAESPAREEKTDGATVRVRVDPGIQKNEREVEKVKEKERKEEGPIEPLQEPNERLG